MRRFGRRLDVERLRAELPLAPFFFDCLHLDGEDLLDRPAQERFAALAERVPDGMRVPRELTGDPARARAFLDEALAHGHEGLVAKAPEAPYEAGRRGAGWLKVKRARTLDLVVLAVQGLVIDDMAAPDNRAGDRLLATIHALVDGVLEAPPAS